MFCAAAQSIQEAQQTFEQQAQQIAEQAKQMLDQAREAEKQEQSKVQETHPTGYLTESGGLSLELSSINGTLACAFFVSSSVIIMLS